MNAKISEQHAYNVAAKAMADLADDMEQQLSGLRTKGHNDLADSVHASRKRLMHLMLVEIAAEYRDMYAALNEVITAKS